ncbi:hypothetical protein V498_09850, partial [Pseudogymnoascus sp. VKM F-4517 (FW-2822)]
AGGGEAGGGGWDGGAGVEGGVFLVLVVGPDALEAGGDGAEDLGLELGGVVFEAADAPAEEAHEIGADHGRPVHEELLEDLLGKEPLEADDFLSGVDDCDDVPGRVYEGKDPDFRHLVVALQHLLANFKPEPPVNAVDMEFVRRIIPQVYRYNLLQEIAQDGTSVVVIHRCPLRGRL